MSRTNAYAKIRRAMIANERYVYTEIRRANKEGQLYRPFVIWSSKFYNALERLVAKGRVVFHRRGFGYGYATKDAKNPRGLK